MIAVKIASEVTLRDMGENDHHQIIIDHKPLYIWWDVLYIIESINRADSRFAPSQWETVLVCNNICHWLGASLELALLNIRLAIKGRLQ